MKLRERVRETTDRWRMILGAAAPVMLYHATYSQPPREIAEGLHNVHPEIMREQIALLKRHFRFVSIDELAEARRSRGVAAITFDDAYRCVQDEAFPVLEELDVPFCIFVNGCTLEGKTLWRDKIRYLINHNLADEFQSQATHTQPVGDKSFYRYTKEAPNNSRLVEEELDAFLAERGVSLQASDYYLSQAADFLRHPLVSYGNHTHDHYVLTTLTDEQQHQQISATHAALARVDGINRSHVLSIPFGKPRHFDHYTAIVAREFGYRCLLMSRNQIPPRLKAVDDPVLIERFMPDERPISTIFTEILKRNAA